MKYKFGDYLRLKDGRIDGPIQEVLLVDEYPYRTARNIYKESEIKCKIEVKDVKEEKWENSPTWNGDYDPKNPESFEAWAKGKKIRWETWAESQYCEFLSLGNTDGTFRVSGNWWDVDWAFSNPSGRWYEFKAPALKPYDNDHLPSCFTFREKETGNIYTMNYDSIENSFWCALGEGGRYWDDPAQLLANCENLDRSPCGWIEDK